MGLGLVLRLLEDEDLLMDASICFCCSIASRLDMELLPRVVRNETDGAELSLAMWELRLNSLADDEL